MVAIEKGKHQLSVHLPEDDVWIFGDKVRLSQVVSNLLTNAAKFTEQGGKISVDASVAGELVVIRVSDNGIGIDPRNLDKIFQLFVQSGHLENRVQDGLGIGLSLVKTLVELHGGTVHVESPGVGQGSTFEVCLPMVEAQETGQPEPAPAAAAPIEPKRVLVVDDNVDAADTLAQLLSLMGYGQAHHREEALNAGFNQHFAKPVDFEKLGLLGLYV